MPAFERSNVKASKVTPTQVVEIKERYAKGETQGSLCRAFGLSVGQIGRIVRGESWGHLGGGVTTDAEAEASMVRFIARQQAIAELQARSVPSQAAEAEAALEQLAPKRELPRSPLDDGDAPGEAQGALDVLQRRAQLMGVDIEKLSNEGKAK